MIVMNVHAADLWTKLFVLLLSALSLYLFFIFDMQYGWSVMIEHKIAQASSNLMCLFAPAGRLKNMLLTRFFPIFPGAPAAGSRRSARAIAMRCFLGGERKEQPWNSHGFQLPSGKNTKKLWKITIVVGKSTISLFLWRLQVRSDELPEGTVENPLAIHWGFPFWWSRPQ